PLLACPVTASPSLLVVSPLIAYSKTSRTPLPGIRTRKRAGRVEPTPFARPSAPLPSPPPTGGPRTWSQRSTGLRRSVVADCVCDLYGGCCGDARQRENDDQQRALMAADWLFRSYVPSWLRVAGLEAAAARIEAHGPFTDWSMLDDVSVSLRTAADEAAAAWAAARGTAVAAAAAAAWAAAGAAARVADWAAARDTAGAADWAAAGAAARAAADAAARAAAIDRMCHLEAADA